MRITPDQDQINEIKSIWQAIRWRMNERRLAPMNLAYRTKYSKNEIERGIAGEPVEITVESLRDCVMAFGLTSGRTKHYEETVEDLSWDECVRLIKPQPAMPPRQGNFWDYV